MDEKEALRTLARQIIAANELTEHVFGQLMVLTSAVSALVRSHPDPEAFATSMRRSWMQSGQSHASSESTPSRLSGIDAALAVIEGAARVPLHLRAPSAAASPDD